MRDRTTAIRSTTSYKLYKGTSRKTGRVKFFLGLKYTWRLYENKEKLYNHFDPFRNRRVGCDMVCKFETQKEIEELISVAKLKGLF